MGRWAILNGLLVLIALVLTVQIARTWGRSLPPVEVSPRGAEPIPRGDGEGKSEGKAGGGRRDRGKRGAADKAEQQPAALVATIVNKDLFDPSRQKPTEEVKAPPPKEIGPPPNLTVVGVRMIGREAEAFVTDAAQGNQQRRLRVGDQVGDYTLKTIKPNRVTLASATGDVITLNLAVDKSAGGAPKPPTAPTPPRPGQPAAAAATPPAAGVRSPAAGVTAPAAGVTAPAAGAPVARTPRAAVPAARPGAPAAVGVPPAPGTPQAPAAPGTPPAPAAPGSPAQNPNLPAAVREKLEQLKRK